MGVYADKAIKMSNDVGVQWLGTVADEQAAQISDLKNQLKTLQSKVDVCCGSGSIAPQPTTKAPESPKSESPENPESPK